MRNQKSPWMRDVIGFLWGTVALVVLICGGFEWFKYGELSSRVRAEAKTVATEYAGTIARRLFNQFTELEFIGVSLLAPAPDGTIAPSPRTVRALYRFMALHPSLYAFNVQSPDGNRIIWSTKKQPKRPITLANGFTPLASHPQYLLGRPRYAARVHSYAITMRFRDIGANGQTRYFVGTPYRLDRLLAYAGHARLPLTLAVTDMRNRSNLVVWHNGRLEFSSLAHRGPHQPAAAGAGATPAASTAEPAAVPGLPLEVTASWPAAYVTNRWVSSGWIRWSLEILFVVILSQLVMLVARSRRREQIAAEALERARRVDDLTGLATRTRFEEEIPALCSGLAPGRQLAVIVVDIEDFSDINARIGRAAGDNLLRTLAQRLAALPDAVLHARVGADSFAFAHADIAEGEMHARIDAVLAVAAEPFQIAGATAETIGISLGSALYPADTDSAASLLGRAEISLFGQVQRRYGSRRRQLDPYSSEHILPIAWALRFLRPCIPDIAQAMLDDIMSDPRNRAVMEPLDEGRHERLKLAVARHILMLLDPALNPERHRAEASRIGRLHVALGVDISARTNAMSGLYQRISVASQRIPGRISQRQLYLDIILQRCELDMEIQQDAAAGLRHEIHRTLGTLALETRRMTRSVDVCDAITAALAGWPFIACCAIYTEAVDGRLVIESESSGHAGMMERHPTLRLGGLKLKDLGDHPIARAWFTAEPERGPAHAFVGPDDADACQRVLAAEGVLSAVALPITELTGRLRAVLVMYGRLPNQFAAPVTSDSLEALSLIAARGLEQTRDESLALMPAAERQAWRSRLFDGGLQMFMQPIVNLRTGKVAKLEALARLDLGDGRLVGPGQFLPVLSQQDLDRLFIEGMHQAMHAVCGYRRLGFDVDLSLNLPPTTLRHPDCVRWIRAALDTFDLDPRRLTLELLEDQDFVAGDLGLSTIETLHHMGVQLALDDLGAGYGSLMRLRNLPFDMVKIDQGLVRGISAQDERSIKLVEALVQLALRLEIAVTVEGLETPELIDMALRCGAGFGQGYGIARPMPADRVPAWLAEFHLDTEGSRASFIALF